MTSTAPAVVLRTVRSNQLLRRCVWAMVLSLHFDARFFFERLDERRSVFCSEAKGNRRCEIFFRNVQRRNGRPQTCSKFFNETRILQHELECEAGRKIAFQDVLTIAYQQR